MPPPLVNPLATGAKEAKKKKNIIVLTIKGVLLAGFYEFQSLFVAISHSERT
jgi:hypothetical protein